MPFHNTSKLTFARLKDDPGKIARNLASYIKSSSANVRGIFDPDRRRLRPGRARHGVRLGVLVPAPMLEAAGLERGMAALDVAAGTGLVTREAMGIVGDSAKVIALDPSVGMLLAARARLPMPAVQAAGENLPFGDGSFDFLSMGFALRHVADVEVVFREFSLRCDTDSALAGSGGNERSHLPAWSGHRPCRCAKVDHALPKYVVRSICMGVS